MSLIPGYYTPAEAAVIIGVSRAQITRYMQDGKLRGRDLGHQILIRQEDVDKFERPPRGNPQFSKHLKS